MGKTRNGSSAPEVPVPKKFSIVECQVETLQAHVPETYEQILTLLANGHSPSKVTMWTGIETDVVRRIRDLNPQLIARIKECLAANLAEAAQVLSERLIAAAPRLEPQFLAKALAIAVDKHQLLSGGVTARTEHRTVPTPDELQAMFDSLPKAKVEVIEEGTKDNGEHRHAGS